MAWWTALIGSKGSAFMHVLSFASRQAQLSLMVNPARLTECRLKIFRHNYLTIHDVALAYLDCSTSFPLDSLSLLLLVVFGNLDF